MAGRDVPLGRQPIIVTIRAAHRGGVDIDIPHFLVDSRLADDTQESRNRLFAAEADRSFAVHLGGLEMRTAKGNPTTKKAKDQGARDWNRSEEELTL